MLWLQESGLLRPRLGLLKHHAEMISAEGGHGTSPINETGPTLT